jgi:Flp pilus assembly protein TadD
MKPYILSSLAISCAALTAAADTVVIGDFYAEKQERTTHNLLSLALPYLIARVVNNSKDCQALFPVSVSPKSSTALYDSHGSPRITEARRLCTQVGADRYLLGKCRRKESEHKQDRTLVVTFHLGTGTSNEKEVFSAVVAGPLSLPELAYYAGRKICGTRRASKAPKFPPLSLPAFSQVLRLMREGDMRRAEGLASKLCTSYPGFADAHYLGGLIAAREKKPYRALRLFNRARAIDSRFSLPAFAEGKVWLSLDRATLADTAFAQAVRIQPSFFEAWLQLGILKATHGNSRQAIAALTHALKLRPKNPAARYWFAYCLSETGEKNKAKALLLPLVSESPEFCAAHYLLGKLYFQDLDFQNALRELRLAVKFCPRDSDARKLLGETFSRLGRHAEAMRAFRKALELQNR